MSAPTFCISDRSFYFGPAAQITSPRIHSYKIDYTRVVDSLIRGLGDQGSRQSYYGLAQSLKIGDLEFKDCVVTVSEKSNYGNDVSGIIGIDVFKEFLIKLDYNQRMLELSPLPQLPVSQRTKMTG